MHICGRQISDSFPSFSGRLTKTWICFETSSGHHCGQHQAQASTSVVGRVPERTNTESVFIRHRMVFSIQFLSESALRQLGFGLLYQHTNDILEKMNEKVKTVSRKKQTQIETYLISIEKSLVSTLHQVDFRKDQLGISVAIDSSVLTP